MKILEFAQPVNEATMNPSAFAQSLEQGQQQGVLVGFEFEVCVPRETIKKVTNEDWTTTYPKNWYTQVDPDDVCKLKKKVEFDGEKFDKMYALRDAYNFFKVVKNFEKFYRALPKETQNKILRRVSVENRKKLLFVDNEPVITRKSVIFILPAARDYYYRASNEWPTNKALISANARIAAEKTYDNLKKLTDAAFVGGRTSAFWKTLFGTSDIVELAKNPALKFDEDAFVEDYDDDYDYDYRGAMRSLKPALEQSFGDVKVFTSYHEKKKNLTHWYIEPDGSLHPEYEDGAAEIVSPPLPVNHAMTAVNTFYSIAKQLNLYTGEEYGTGFHINVSIPTKIDVLKLAVLLGDQYVLQAWGRTNNEYSPSAIDKLKNRIKADGGVDTDIRVLTRMMDSITSAHFSSISFNGKYVSFRQVGGDYLSDMPGVINAIGRFVRAITIASDPNAYQEDYLKKLYAIIQSTVPKSSNVRTTGYAEVLKFKNQPIPTFATVYYAVSRRTLDKLTVDLFNTRRIDISKLINSSPNESTKSAADQLYQEVFNQVKNETQKLLTKYGMVRGAFIYKPNIEPLRLGAPVSAIYKLNAFGDDVRTGLQFDGNVVFQPGTPAHTYVFNAMLDDYKAAYKTVRQQAKPLPLPADRPIRRRRTTRR
jgi:hypothetical protein